MVFYLRQATILALTTLWLGCQAPQEPLPEPADEPGQETENGDETTVNDFLPVPDIGAIRSQIDPNCSENGCIQAVEYFGAYDTATLNEVIPLGVNILNGYSVWQVTYVTHERRARATITLPFEKHLKVCANERRTMAYNLTFQNLALRTTKGEQRTLTAKPRATPI